LSFIIRYNELQNTNHLLLFHKIFLMNIYIPPANYTNLQQQERQPHFYFAQHNKGLILMTVFLHSN
jgi:hypothetical protein